MSLNVNAEYSAGISATYAAIGVDTASITAQTEALAAEEKKAEDGFVKSEVQKPVTYKPDMEKVNSMKGELKGNMAAFRTMVRGLFNTQGTYAMDAMSNIGDLLQVDEATRANAQAAIAEDGEWGVEATANRILEFAKAISGGDPSKIEMLREAVEEGFKAAEQIWGGKLPDISKQTYDRVMKGFDDWAEEASGVTKPAEEEE